MFKFLKKLFGREGKVPTVEMTGFRHGLVTFRSDHPLSLQELVVQTPTPAGRLKTRVDIQSYDPDTKEYLARVDSDSKALESLDIDLSEIAAVSKVLRVSSPTLPNYTGLTEEISLSGLRLSTKESLSVGRLFALDIDFDVAKIGMVKVKAVVEWSAQKADRSFHSGLRFHDLDSHTFRKLAQYIQYCRT